MSRLTFVVTMLVLVVSSGLYGGQWPKEMHAYRGTTPMLDGVITPGEYADATKFTGMKDWYPQFNKTTDDKDVSLVGYVKHDGKNLYFAFDVTDDVLYGIDTERWLPDDNPKAHELTREGYPWFGDGMEILINASYQWLERDGQNNRSDGSCWQMVCSLTKSRLGGIGVGGLMEGEDREINKAWNNYSLWIKTGAMKAIATPKKDGKGYVVEWMIQPNPCLEVKPGEFWDPKMGTVKMGLNFGNQDLDEREKGEGNFGNFNHEDWWTGVRDKRTWIKQWGTLYLHPDVKPIRFYVDPVKGKDSATGLWDEPIAVRPFKTIDRAQRAVQKLVELGLKKDVEIILKAGRYEIDKPITLGPKDSGTKEHSITWTAFPGDKWPVDKVSISGGKEIKGWKKGKNNVWTTTIPDVKAGKWWFRQLFVDGKRVTRARFPNAGSYLKLTEISKDVKNFTFDQQVPAKNLGGSDAELVVLMHWSSCRGIITASKGNTAQTATYMGWPGHGPTTAAVGEAAFIEHSLALLDAPGEWYLDCKTGKLSYMAAEGENPNEQSFIAPKLDQILVIKGSEENPVQNVHFKGITFEHTQWKMPEFGYRGIQAGYNGPSWIPRVPVYCQPASIMWFYAQDCSMELCRVARSGTSGIGIGAGCDNNKITACEVVDYGVNGIHLGIRTKPLDGEEDTQDEDWPNLADAPVGNKVTNNYVHDGSNICFGGVGIIANFVPDSVIANNVVTDLPYTGISVGWRWGPAATSQKNVLVEHNQVYNIMQTLADGGSLYFLGNQPGTVIRENLLHSVPRSGIAFGGSPNNGIFFDWGCKGYLVENNMIFDTSGKPTRFNHAEPNDLTWGENYFDVGPTDINFPWFRAALTGIEPAYRDKVMGLSVTRDQ
ncbi:hypothetical protein ACFL3G_00635 [Planctomycetota bacterium]